MHSDWFFCKTLQNLISCDTIWDSFASISFCWFSWSNAAHLMIISCIKQCNVQQTIYRDAKLNLTSDGGCALVCLPGCEALPCCHHVRERGVCGVAAWDSCHQGSLHLFFVRLSAEPSHAWTSAFGNPLLLEAGSASTFAVFDFDPCCCLFITSA